MHLFRFSSVESHVLYFKKYWLELIKMSSFFLVVASFIICSDQVVILFSRLYISLHKKLL